MKDQIAALIADTLNALGISGVVPEVEIPENPAHGDYSSSVAMKVAKILKKPAMEIALQVAAKCKVQSSKFQVREQHPKISQKHQTKSGKLAQLVQLQVIDRVEVAPPGFINIFLTEASLSTKVSEVIKEKEGYGKTQTTRAQRVMVEFAHPNTHKAFHIGHVRNIATGESVVRLLESQGARVIRANYQGDVGMHIAKCLYSILQNSKFKIQNSKLKTVQEKVEFLGKAYAAGSEAYEEDEKAKAVIIDLNAKVYASAQGFHRENGVDTGSFDYLSLVSGSKKDIDAVFELWKETRQWSLDYFETIYKRLGSHFDRYYFESECLAGVDRAREAVKKGILAQSEGAIIFDGKPYGLDTRVFVNSLGLPTYEAKELLLAEKEFVEFGKLDRVIHVVGPEQGSFFQVTFKVEELLGLQKDQQYHLAYGWVRLKQGKMSSRLGNVVLGEWLIDSLKQKIYNILEKSHSKYSKDDKDLIADKAAVAAVKYSFLRVSTNQEIAFDLDESINFEGDSGPYLLYTYARCKSVLRKAGDQSYQLSAISYQLNSEERAVCRLITHFPDVVADSAANLAPSTLCKYLFELAQAFNLFYAKHTILEAVSHQSAFRLAMTAAVSQVLKNGLHLLGIATIERM